MSKNEYISLPTVEENYKAKNASSTYLLLGDEDSSLSFTFTNNADNAYTRPSFELNGNVSYLQEPEDLPQGRHLGIFSTIVLFISRMVGSGIFATPSSIYQDVGGSPILFLLTWLIAAILALCGLYVYLELGSLIPRNGGTKAFLEVIYARPAYLFSVVFLVYSVAFGFTLLNALVFGEYFLHSLGIELSDFRIKAVGLGMIYITVLVHGISVSLGIKIQNFVGGLKLALMAVMTLTGIYVVCFPKSITKLETYLSWDSMIKPNDSNWTFSSSLFASAIIKASYSYSGWGSVHTVSSEIKDPIRTFKIAGPVSLALVTISYVFTNLAYLFVIPPNEILNGGKLIGSALFEKVFGVLLGRKFLTLSIAISTASNILVVIYTISRVSQEVFREGFLPCLEFMASNWPWGSPLPTLLLSAFLSTVILLIPTNGGDIYNYIISFEGYPQQIFIILVTVGVYILRHRFPEVKAPIRSSLFGSLVVIVISLYIIISPLTSKVNPNPQGFENWISYPILGLLSLFVCFLYWAVMFKVWPRIYGYELVPEENQLDDGLVIKRWVKLFS